MGKRRKAFVHVGLDDGSGDFVGGAAQRHRRALLELGVCSPATCEEEMFRAALEMLRTHQDWGYERAEVEGVWTAIARRAAQEKGRDTVLVSQPMLAAARPEQIALTLDALSDFETHVVVTAQAPDAWTEPGHPGHDLASVLERWSAGVRRPERLHVVVGTERAQVWKRLGKVVGFGTSSLGVADVAAPPRVRPPHLASPERSRVLDQVGRGWVELLEHTGVAVVGDPSALVPAPGRTGSPATTATVTEMALNDALHEVERLTRRNQTLELRVEALERKRRKLKRRLSEVA